MNATGRRSPLGPLALDEASHEAPTSTAAPPATAVEVVSGPRIRRLELRLVREARSVVLRGRCWPAWPDAEVEISTQGDRRARALASDGTFEVPDLPPHARHANVVVRGPGAPAICVIKLPVE